ncbi:MAG: hypothetical protein LBB91_04210 [Clostridiales bacterium]|nr:hypothetical protein [Clostridiales bacterium]
MKKKTSDSVPVNQALLNVITPMGLEIKRNSLVIGENTGRVYGVVKYPQKVDMGWLSKITNIPSTIVSIGFKPIDNSELITAISKSIVHNRAMADSAKDPLTRQRAEKAAEDGDRIMLQIDQEGETVGLMSISIMPIARDDKTFTKVTRRVDSILGVMKCKGRALASLQKEGLQNISPTFPAIGKIENIIQRIVPMSTFVGGFPFASSGFNDGTGYYFAKDSSGGLIIVDTWKRGDDRTNSNMVFMGVAGVGKSTAVKHMALAEYMKGTKLIFIDPESEYLDICLHLNGDWINAGGDKRGLLNPLQIRPAPRDNDGDDKNNKKGGCDDIDQPLYVDEGYGLSDMALHIKNLEIFFKLYIPSLSDMKRAILKQAIIELYNEFSIDWDTDIKKLKNTDFPTFSNLYGLLEKKAETQKDEEHKELALLFHDLALGSDQFLWNGHSTVETSSRCICLDTNSLQNTGDNIKRAQYFTLLSWCWEQMSKDRGERVMLICDEAYLMIDENVPQSLVFLRNVAKRARKYEAGLVIVSHSVVDFLSPNIKQYGQALLDIPCYKILMGTDGKNLLETKELYSLTEAEEELLLAKKRAHALFVIGSKRLHINFEIPEYKLDCIGGAGGR